jgi:hypothetical protein
MPLHLDFMEENRTDQVNFKSDESQEESLTDLLKAGGQLAPDQQESALHEHQKLL